MQAEKQITVLPCKKLTLHSLWVLGSAPPALISGIWCTSLGTHQQPQELPSFSLKYCSMSCLGIHPHPGLGWEGCPDFCLSWCSDSITGSEQTADESICSPPQGYCSFSPKATSHHCRGNQASALCLCPQTPTRCAYLVLFNNGLKTVWNEVSQVKVTRKTHQILPHFAFYRVLPLLVLLNFAMK